MTLLELVLKGKIKVDEIQYPAGLTNEPQFYLNNSDFQSELFRKEKKNHFNYQ